jgi:hypothetical protein
MNPSERENIELTSSTVGTRACSGSKGRCTIQIRFFCFGRGDLYIQETLCIGIKEDFATNLSTYLSNRYVQ